MGFIQGVVEGLRRKPSGTGAPGQTDAFQPGGARQHVAQGFQVANQPLQDEASIIGIKCRPSGELDGCGHVVTRHEELQSKVAHCQPSVVRTGLSAGCAVVGQSRHRRGDLLGQPHEQRAGQMRAIEPALTGVPKQRDMDGQCEPVGGTSARVDQLQVFIGQDVIALQ